MNLSLFISLFVSIAFAQNPQQGGVIVPTAPAVMISIAQCESHTQQFKSDGSLVRDHVTGDHVGIFQISQTIWSAKASAMGFDITKPEGNIAMALWIYDHYGISPWTASEDCWAQSGVYV